MHCIALCEIVWLWLSSTSLQVVLGKHHHRCMFRPNGFQVQHTQVAGQVCALLTSTTNGLEFTLVELLVDLGEILGGTNNAWYFKRLVNVMHDTKCDMCVCALIAS